MILVNYTEFRSNLKKYLQLALSERVVLRNNGAIFEITPSKDVRLNPSPSQDKWFDNQLNINTIEQGIAETEAALCGEIQTTKWNDLKGACSTRG